MEAGKEELILDILKHEKPYFHDFSTSELADFVDDYLEYCKATGKQPDKVYKGSFNVRIAPDLHKAVAILASQNHESLNQTVESAIEWYIKQQGISA